MKRRDLLISGGSALAGTFLMAQKPAVPILPPPAPPPSTPTILTTSLSVFKTLAGKAYARTLTQADQTLGWNQMQQLITFLENMGFDYIVMSRAATINPLTLNLGGSPAIGGVHSEVSTANPNISYAYIQSAYTRSLAGANLVQLHSYITSQGATPALRGIAPAWLDFGPEPVSNCDTVNWYLNWLGLAIAELGLGCLPDNPFFTEICGIVVILGIIWFVINVIQSIFCV